MHILVVEDAAFLRSAFCTLLRLQSYTATEAENGRVALDLLMSASLSVDVIITDLMMPIMDGIELLRELQDAGNVTPIIVLTADDSTSTKRLAMELGAREFLVKPIDFEQLYLIIRKYKKHG